MITGDAIFFLALVFIPLGLTITMFTSKQIMLGFPAALFWIILGAYSFIQSTVAWDVFFLVGFAAMLGMVFLCVFGGYSWKVNKRGQVVEGEPDDVDDTEGEKYYGENKGDGEMRDLDDNRVRREEPDIFHQSIDQPWKTSIRRQNLRKRAEQRRSGDVAKKGWGEFK